MFFLSVFALLMASYGVDGSVFQMGGMIQCISGYGPIKQAATFLNFGCYCGYGGTGHIVNEIDGCCFVHDHCYDKVSRACSHEINVYLHGYQYACKHRRHTRTHNVQCREKMSRCERALCRCDQRIARCFNNQELTFARIIEGKFWSTTGLGTLGCWFSRSPDYDLDPDEFGPQTYGFDDGPRHSLARYAGYKMAIESLSAEEQKHYNMTELHELQRTYEENARKYLTYYHKQIGDDVYPMLKKMGGKALFNTFALLPNNSAPPAKDYDIYGRLLPKYPKPTPEEQNRLLDEIMNDKIFASEL